MTRTSRSGPRSWRATIVEQRLRIARVLAESPSLRTYPASVLAGAYTLGRNIAITETGLAEEVFPERPPYAAEDVLDADFFPPPR